MIIYRCLKSKFPNNFAGNFGLIFKKNKVYIGFIIKILCFYTIKYKIMFLVP